MRKWLWFLWIGPCFATQLPIDPSIVSGTLDNGITYYVCPRENQERIALRLVLPVGSIDERPGEEGIAHFVEHLVFRGTDHFSAEQIDALLESHDADGNAHTSFDETVYQINLPPDQIELGLALMSDFASCAKLEEAAIEAERGIVLEEWRLGRDSSSRMAEQVLSALCEGSPYAERFPIGLETVIRTANQRTIRGFYERCYKGAPLSVVAVGSFDPEEVIALIEKQFGHLPDVRPTPSPYPFEMGKKRRFCFLRDPEVTGVELALLFSKKGQAIDTQEQLRAALVASLFHALFYSRLSTLAEYTALGDELECQTVSLIPGLEIDQISTHCSTEQLASVFASLVAELRRVQIEGFTNDEFNSITKTMRELFGIHERSQLTRSNAQIAKACVQHALLNSPLMSPEQRGMFGTYLLDTIAPADVQAYANTLNVNTDCLIFVVTPHHWDGEALLQKALTLACQAPIVPYSEPTLPLTLMDYKPQRGRLIDSQQIPAIALTTLRFDNGATVHLLPTSNAKGEVILQATALGGLSHFSPPHLATARLAAPLLNLSGLGGYSPPQLTRILKGCDASIHAFIAPYTRLLMGSARGKNIESLLQMLYLRFSGSPLSEEGFNRLKEKWTHALENKEVDPEAYLKQQSLLLHHKGTDFFVPTKITDIEKASFTTAAALGQRAFSNPADFVFCLVGDFDLETGVDLATCYIGSLPHIEESWRNYEELEDTFPQGIHQVNLFKGHEPRSIVQLTFPITATDPSPQSLELMEACGELIRQRVYRLLRERLSSTYHVEEELEFIWPSTRLGLLTLRFTCDPSDAPLLAGIALRELRLLKERGPTNEEVWQMVRRIYQHTQLQGSTSWSTELTHYVQMGWDLETLATRGELYKNIDREKVHQTLQQMLPLEQYSQIILSPKN
ncbi:MAG: insulinase family protein [Verrucomicrobia bacterium]|nr:insulinase family protein [Verrucomicrobiota bacterium]